MKEKFLFAVFIILVASLLVCGKCGFEWSPIIVTGKCPNCSNQEGHKFKEQKNG